MNFIDVRILYKSIRFEKIGACYQYIVQKRENAGEQSVNKRRKEGRKELCKAII